MPTPALPGMPAVRSGGPSASSRCVAQRSFDSEPAEDSTEAGDDESNAFFTDSEFGPTDSWIGGDVGKEAFRSVTAAFSVRGFASTATSSTSRASTPEQSRQQSLEQQLYSELQRLQLDSGARGSQDASSAQAAARAAVRRQWLADACRARYVVDGVEFWFERERAVVGDRAQDPDAAALCRADFLERLLKAVLESVGDESSLAANAAMLLLSQTSLALCLTACQSPPISLCGGTRRLTFELSTLEPGKWQVQGNFCAYGFSQVQVQSGEGIAEGCSTASSVHRGFAATLSAGASASSASPTDLVVRVIDVFEDLAIFSPTGIPFNLEKPPCPLEAPREAPKAEPTGAAEAIGWLEAAGRDLSSWLLSAKGSDKLGPQWDYQTGNTASSWPKGPLAQCTMGCQMNPLEHESDGF